MNQNISPQGQFSPTPTTTDIELLKLAARIRSGSGWLYAVAAFSAVNSLINVFGGNMYFLIGLGITQIIDAFGSVFAAELPNLATILQGATVALSLGVSGILAGFAFFARRGHAWAFILAGLGYGIDALLVLYFQDFGGAIFHALALFYIGSGALAALKFHR